MAHKKRGTSGEKETTALIPCPKCGKDIPAKWNYHSECGWKQDIQEEETQIVGKSKVEVFTSPTCPHCSSAAKLVREIGKERDDVRVVETSTATGYGQKRAKQLGIMAVPSVFVSGPAYAEHIGFKGLPSKKGLLKAIDISLGLAMWEEKKGFFEKLIDKLGLREE